MSWHFRSSDTIADTIVSVLQALKRPGFSSASFTALC